MYDILIVGGGPAGLTAALYAARAGKSVLVCERELTGGQIVYSPMVDNYPALPHVSGAAFAEQLTAQAEAVGVSIEFAHVLSIARSAAGFIIDTDLGRKEARAVILAPGVRRRKIGLPGEAELTGSGISYCAICDGAFYRGRAVAIVGGGDTAVHEALYLSGICSHVTLIHRRDAFRAEAVQVAQLNARENITLCLNAIVTDLEANDGALCAVTVTDRTGREERLEVDGLFVAIGQQSDNTPFAPLVQLDEAGYIQAGEDTCTSCPGIFAAGDCRGKQVRQLTTAVGDGAVAALAACRYLEQ